MTNNSEPIDCIITAAGLSSRMGDWKMMMPYKNTTILDTSINNALTYCQKVILVTGFRSDELFEQYELHPNVLVVENVNYQQGLKSSVIEGMKHVESDYFFITHGDMPLINKNIYHELWLGRHRGVLFPGDTKQSGHPVLISSCLINELSKDPTGSSMKRALLDNKVKYLSLPYKEIFIDIDTQSDYKKWKRV